MSISRLVGSPLPSLLSSLRWTQWKNQKQSSIVVKELEELMGGSVWNTHREKIMKRLWKNSPRRTPFGKRQLMVWGAHWNMVDGNKNEGNCYLLGFLSRILKFFFYVILHWCKFRRKKTHKCKFCNYPGDLGRSASQFWIVTINVISHKNKSKLIQRLWCSSYCFQCF